MALYRIILSKQVRKKDIPKISRERKPKIIDTIASLSNNPRPKSGTKLTNREEYRLRVGVYRILYVINDKEEVISVRKVAHRGEAYKK